MLHLNFRWLHSVDSKPGINTGILDTLARKRQEDPDKYGTVCMMIDAMAIRKQIQYDASRGCMVGYMDLGDGPDETTVATEAVVIMLVGLKGYWKAPIAYFISKTLTPDTQKTLVEHVLNACHDRGLKVVCLTMDGHASNISMVTMLGCQLKITEQNHVLKTYFPHPSSGAAVYVIMDACHMLKLSRNMLEAYRSITGPDGEINWKYLTNLHTVQIEEGLHAANKLSDKHINFQNQKMKVNLAAQTFSNSVANALQLMHDLQHQDFLDCLPTVKFIQVYCVLLD